ncbi:hypothetical protein ACOBQJ_10490 [Pelotomaculum propionicicum]|uniref:hypothetical protein n=1 Tax=Pelotomaculum propionicicum TaxID=258475 RepID=UPI003B7EB4EB
MEKLLLFLLQGIPESSGQFALSLALLGVPLRWKRIIAAGTVFALIMFSIRTLPFTFGIHTAVGVFIIVFAINRTISHIPITKIFIAVLVNFSTLLLLEYVIMEIFFAATGLDPNSTIAENSNVLWILSGLPQALLLNVFALLVVRYKKPQEDALRI